MPDIVLIADTARAPAKLITALSTLFWVETLSPEAARSAAAQENCVVLANVDLGDKAAVLALKDICAKLPDTTALLVMVDAEQPVQKVQARALGADEILDRTAPFSRLVRVLEGLLEGIRGPEGADAPPDVKAALDEGVKLTQRIAIAVQAATPLPKAGIEATSEKVIGSVLRHGTETWLDAVRQYHSNTYRHCMMVTGVAISFGEHLGETEEAVRRLAVAAILHDVGKVRIPISILEKPAKLTADEFAIVKRHPVHSGEILKRDGQFDAEIIDAAVHHHEYLDGSGYPDGLSADEIPPLVRMITICDIYSALMERRAYKEPFTPRQALATMVGMGGKLDETLLARFRPLVARDDFCSVKKAPRPASAA